MAMATSPKSDGARYQARMKVLSAESPATTARDKPSHMLPFMSRSATLLMDGSQDRGPAPGGMPVAMIGLQLVELGQHGGMGGVDGGISAQLPLELARRLEAANGALERMISRQLPNLAMTEDQLLAEAFVPAEPSAGRLHDVRRAEVGEL